MMQGVGVVKIHMVVLGAMDAINQDVDFAKQMIQQRIGSNAVIFLIQNPV